MDITEDLEIEDLEKGLNKEYKIELLYAGSGDIVFRDIINENQKSASAGSGDNEKQGSAPAGSGYIVLDVKNQESAPEEQFCCNFKNLKKYIVCEETNMLRTTVTLTFNKNAITTYGNICTSNQLVKIDSNSNSVEIWKKVLKEELNKDDMPVLYFKKTNTNTEIFTFPGPECIDPNFIIKRGLQDIGCFSIESTHNSTLNLVKTRIKEIQKEKKYDKIVIDIQGHSRGAVAASLVAEDLVDLNDDNLVVYYKGHDSVPGPYDDGLKSWLFSEMSEEEKKRIKTSRKKKLGNKSVVIYAIASGYNDMFNFKPRKLYEADVAIIDSGNHAVKTYMGKEKNSLYEYNGETQCASKLDPGLYFEFGYKLRKISDNTEASKKYALDAISIIIAKCSPKEKMRGKFLLNLIYQRSSLTIDDLFNCDNQNIENAFIRLKEFLKSFKKMEELDIDKKEITKEYFVNRENISKAIEEFQKKFFPFSNEIKKFVENISNNAQLETYKLIDFLDYMINYHPKSKTELKKAFFKKIRDFSREIVPFLP